jgi:dTDP-4-dehydrorhamnose 3,5-epimerase
LKFHELSLQGAFLVEPDFHLDVRGSFGRTFCKEEFVARGLDATVAQCSLSFNRLRGTVRGVHFQSEPLAETKLVRVQRGAIWDVIVDLRKSSRTFSRWFATELTGANACALYVPKGFGHAFMTLEDDTEVYYQMSAVHVPRLARGIRWNDPSIAIAWPLQPTAISEKDSALPLLAEIADELYC